MCVCVCVCVVFYCIYIDCIIQNTRLYITSFMAIYDKENKRKHNKLYYSSVGTHHCYT